MCRRTRRSGQGASRSGSIFGYPANRSTISADRTSRVASMLGRLYPTAVHGCETTLSPVASDARAVIGFSRSKPLTAATMSANPRLGAQRMGGSRRIGSPFGRASAQSSYASNPGSRPFRLTARPTAIQTQSLVSALRPQPPLPGGTGVAERLFERSEDRPHGLRLGHRHGARRLGPGAGASPGFRPQVCVGQR